MTVAESKALLEHLRGLPTVSFAAGERLLRAGERSGKLLVLRKGRVEVSSEGVVLVELEAPGTVMGEVASLLNGPHTADLRAVTRTECHVIDAARVLREDPVLTLHVAVLLAQRLERLTQQIVALKGGAEAGKAIDQPLDQLAKAVLFGGFA
ncbi:MAG TPA: cyclic nucleotide-binding domain-containing protein [Burkholderiales bacterium]|nr:cyclic nucleotide-binding domain-containing protein [Burkholderiales bacterium]